MCAFDKLCNEVTEKRSVRKRKYTYRIYHTAYAPNFVFIIRAENKNIDRPDYRFPDGQWMPYAFQNDNGVWKKIVLLDVYR